MSKAVATKKSNVSHQLLDGNSERVEANRLAVSIEEKIMRLKKRGEPARQEAAKFLESAGILDKQGKLTKHYRKV